MQKYKKEHQCSLSCMMVSRSTYIRWNKLFSFMATVKACFLLLLSSLRKYNAVVLKIQSVQDKQKDIQVK